jgi:uncharacterized repeat protein (TIGR03806 family)
MGSPYPLPLLEVEEAFPHLKFAFPVDIKTARDGSDRIFVVNQNGYVHVFPNRSDVTSAKIFLDLSEHVGRGFFEEGLLAVTFHPKFKENGELFVYYSVKPLATRLSRLRVSKDDPDRADPASEEILLQVEQPYWNHNSGSIEFGPDGYLYVSFGDGGAAHDPHGNGQNPAAYLGKILRIDVDNRAGNRKVEGKTYSVPADNPFVDREGVLPEIWALGFRNPWKMTFDRKTGDLWMADVGQDTWEEVNIVRRGGNYGWNVREGGQPFPSKVTPFSKDLVDPVWAYDHSEGKSITGGSIYRGTALPEIEGWYLCADWLSGNIWGLDWDGERVVQSPRIVAERFSVTAFGEDQNGEILFLAHEELAPIVHSRTTYGKIYRFRRAPKPDVAYPPFPTQLSGTGLFTSVKDMVPVPGLIPYEVNVPLWSDHAGKDRYVALPASGKVVFYDKGRWEFPVGTVTVKTFHLEQVRGKPESARRLETRLMVRSPRGWAGYTYVWNDAQTEATLIQSSLEKAYKVRDGDKEIDQTWYFPSRDDCVSCHSKPKKSVLGLETAQLNREIEHGGVRENQLALLDRLGVFTVPLPRPHGDLRAFPDWDDKAASAQSKARAYLDANCSVCHTPGGPSMSQIDLRHDTPLEKTGLVNSVPSVFTLGPEGTRLVLPGNAELSEIVHRINARGFAQMPPLSTKLVDSEAVAVVRQWIESLGKK